MLCDTTRVVSLSVTMVNKPDPPVNRGVERFICVPLLVKFQVKLAGAGGVHTLAPSVMVPLPLAANVIVLSLKQAGTCADISMPPAFALLNFHDDLVM